MRFSSFDIITPYLMKKFYGSGNVINDVYVCDPNRARVDPRIEIEGLVSGHGSDSLVSEHRL